MSTKKSESTEIVDTTIFEKHITSYIHGMGFIILGAFLFLFLADLVVSILVYFGYLPFHLKSIKGGAAPYSEFLTGQIITQLITALPFVIYFILYNKVNFSQKKTLLCILTISTTAILCYSHWKNQYISFLFSIPVVITSPLDKKRNNITVIICESLIIIYAFFHNLFHDPEINYLVAAVSTTTLLMFYVVSLKIHRTINEVFKEVKEYQNMQEVLFDKIAHDVLTGAYSKSALETNLEKIEDYKSLAFLDIDDFKGINDKKGHHTGDSILRLLVICLKSKELEIYRYGGDEFVILSRNHDAAELETILEKNRKRLSKASQELYMYEVTLSIGIINIDKKKSPEKNIETGDKYMYISKNNGRNRISVQA